ncbi:2OG-Fe(II) oxygenase [Neochlamydia sp. S13]|uniref:2OG-Fe(II) oxygenase n=1 Tax=Neochlamydia sp. S13 TaxID=1353976 RepID=UPI0005AA1A98|nr:2OG-Fe(II) oxygenase [Neochlamydia sp. S13]
MIDLLTILNKLESPGTFTAHGTLQSLLPGLYIDNVGEISLPLRPEQAEQIMAECEQAPYGFKEETLIDTNVRNVWQLSPSALQFRNPDWQEALKKMCINIAKQLGLGDVTVECELYKLLLYGKGCFFLPHRDTEKIDNMFATLVISLPSPHEGGELIISHAGESFSYSFAGNGKFSPEYAVFYADCFHEVKPVLSGYRLCLVYNLALAGRSTQPQLAKNDEIIEHVDSYIQKWSQEQHKFPFLTYLLDHSYTEKNLCLSNLKSSDYAKTSILLKAAAKHQCKAFLCLVSYYEESYGDYYGDGYKRNRYRDDDDSECSESNYTEYGINTTEIYAHNFLGNDGNKIKIAKILLSEDALLADKPLIGGPGRKVSISEATGNSGATKELWYHRGAVIIWPESSDLEVVGYSDLEYGAHYLETLLKSTVWQEGSNLEKVLKLARHILDRCTSMQFYKINVLDSLITLADVDLLKYYLQRYQKYSFSSLDAMSVARLIKLFSLTALKPEIDAIAAKSRGSLFSWLYELFIALKGYPEQRTIVAGYFAVEWQFRCRQKLKNFSSETLTEIFRLLALLDDQERLAEAVTELNSIEDPKFVVEIFAPALLRALETTSPDYGYQRAVFQALGAVYFNRVTEHFGVEPQKPITWARAGSCTCSCEFCQQFNKFLSDPERAAFSIEKTLKRNLLHIQEMIDNKQFDVVGEIISDKNKFSGHFSKNEASYLKALKLFQTAHKQQKQVAALLP